MTSTRTCLVCGRALTATRGRPGRFCSPPQGMEHSPCSRLQSRLDEIQRLAREIVTDLRSNSCDEDVFGPQLMRLRSHLWRESNAATNVGRLRGASSDRRHYKKTRSGWWRSRECDIPVGMTTLRISCYPESRSAVIDAAIPFLATEPTTWDDQGFLMLSGPVTDPQSLEEAIRNAGAFSVRVVEEPASGGDSEGPEAEAVVTPPLEVAAPEVAPEGESLLAAPFDASFDSSDEGLAFARKAAGRVQFAEPPTRRYRGKFWVSGFSADPGIQALVTECGGDLA